MSLRIFINVNGPLQASIIHIHVDGFSSVLHLEDRKCLMILSYKCFTDLSVSVEDGRPAPAFARDSHSEATEHLQLIFRIMLH